jgi:hypothetical protein
MMMIRGSVVYPDPYLVHQYLPGQPLNAAGVDDGKLTEMVRLQRRTFDVAKRRDIRAFRASRQRMGAVRQELRAEPRQRLRRAIDGRLARSITSGRRHRRRPTRLPKALDPR